MGKVIPFPRAFPLDISQASGRLLGMEIGQVVRVMDKTGKTCLWYGQLQEINGQEVKVFCHGRAPQWLPATRILPRKGAVN